jgi:hypothetical protein
MVSVLPAISTVFLHSLMQMLRPAPTIQMATSFLVLMDAVSALLTSADLSFHAQVARLSAAMTEAAELSAHNALKAILALLAEASDVRVVFALRTPHTAHNLMVAQHLPVPSALSLVIVLLIRQPARQSITLLFFQTTVQQVLHTSAQLVTVLLTQQAAQ